MWHALKAQHHKIFNFLYQYACFSNPTAGGDLLCLAAKRNDLSAIKDLLKHGLSIDLKDHEGFTALEKAMEENNVEIVSFLVSNGANGGRGIPSGTTAATRAVFEEMMQKREIGHPINVVDDRLGELVSSEPGRREMALKRERNGGLSSRVNIYRGHPLLKSPYRRAGKLINVPSSFEELKNAMGKLVCIAYI